MRFFDLEDKPHVHAGGSLRVSPSNDSGFRIRLPLKSTVVTVTHRRNKPSQITFSTLTKAVLQIQGPRETISAIYKEAQ